MSDDKKYYLLSLAEDGKGMPLDLEPGSYSEVSRKFDWQISGGAQTDDLVICTRADSELFECVSTGRVYESRRGCYTEEAYQGFVDSFEDDLLPDGWVKNESLKYLEIQVMELTQGDITYFSACVIVNKQVKFGIGLQRGNGLKCESVTYSILNRLGFADLDFLSSFVNVTRHVTKTDSECMAREFGNPFNHVFWE